MPRKTSRRTRARNRERTADAAPSAPDRRDTLRLLRNGALAAAALGGVGVFSVNAVRATAREQDLGRIGNGIPAIVQIHDPSCSLCTELQRQTRRALRAFDEEEVGYLVANINGNDGAALAARYGVGHVTLLLFDGGGEMRQVLHGVRREDELRRHFEAHLARNAGS